MFKRRYKTSGFQQCLRVPRGTYHAPEYIGCDCLRHMAEDTHTLERFAILGCFIIAGVAIGIIILCWPNLAALF